MKDYFISLHLVGSDLYSTVNTDFKYCNYIEVGSPVSGLPEYMLNF